MDKKEMFGVALIIILALSLITLGMNYSDKRSKEVACYKDFSSGSHQNGKIEIIKLKEYSCDIIGYAVENNLKLEWMITPMRSSVYDVCEMMVSRDFINETESTGTNYTESTYYSKGQMGNYYMKNCLSDAPEVITSSCYRGCMRVSCTDSSKVIDVKMCGEDGEIYIDKDYSNWYRTFNSTTFILNFNDNTFYRVSDAPEVKTDGK